MGYDLHITRAENWCENEGHEISPSEWHDIINCDPELRLDPQNGPHFAIWEHGSLDPAAQEEHGRLRGWLNWSYGNIDTKNPDPPLLEKMIDIARLLDARVQGDEGEWYPHDTSVAAATRGRVLPIGSVQSFVLSIGAWLTFFAVVVPLDASIRRHYPSGTPIPYTWGLILVGLTVPSLMSALLGCLFAVFSIATRMPRAPFAWAALAINAMGFCILRFAH